MQVQAQQLKPLSSVALNPDERAIIAWIRSAHWEPQTGEREPIPYKAKVPEFFSGVRFYKVQAGATTGAGAMGALDLLIKKLSFSGIISKQELYPVIAQGASRFLQLKKADLDNLGAGACADEDEDN